MIGDGCGEPTDGGLSDFGRRVVKEMNRVADGRQASTQLDTLKNL
jgi:hypothetical protein